MKNQVFSFMLIYIYTIIALSLGTIFNILIRNDKLSRKLDKIKDIIICSSSIIILAFVMTVIGVYVFIG